MRLFVAIELEPSARAGLEALQRKLDAGCRDVRWVKPELLHVTLKFLGELNDALAVDVTRAVTRVGEGTEPFELGIGGCGCFPPRGEVRIVWAGAEASTGALLGCVEKLEAELGELGFPPEGRAFSPHITIGRVREDHSRGRLRSVVEAARFEPRAQSVSSLVVMSSELSRSGPTYTVISRAMFGERR